MVVAGENFHTLKFLHPLVQRSDRFHIKVVRRLVEEQTVGTADHHFGEETPHLFSAGEHLYLLHAVLARKEHTSKEAAHIRHVLHGRVAHEPVGDGVIVVEFCRVILREIGLRGGDTPFVSAFVRLHLPGQNLKQGGLGQLVAAHKGDFVVMTHDEGEIVQYLFAVYGFA